MAAASACLSIITVLVLMSSVSHAGETFQDFWKRMLPNTPMPSAIRNHLGDGEKKVDANNAFSVDQMPVSMDFDGEETNSNVGVITGVDGKPVTLDLGPKPLAIVYAGVGGMNGGEASDAAQGFIDRPSARSFFLQKDLRPGAKMKMLFRRRLSGDNILHREVADTIPFSSGNISEILRRFNVQPGSPVAKSMERTIRHCEYPTAPGEQKLCATSFEAMVEFVTKSLGTNSVRTLTTVVGKDAPDQVYTVQSASVVWAPGWAATICHIGDYPYTIFQCHRVPLTMPYVVKLEGEDGTLVDAPVACHLDTSTWSTSYYVIKAFNIKPGEMSVCHLLTEGDVLWITGCAKADLPQSSTALNF